jgi:hypothetical protein
MKHEQNMNKIIILYTVTRYSMYDTFIARVNICAFWSGSKLFAYWFIVISDQTATSAEQDQMARMCRLIWIYTGCIRVKMCIYPGKG